MLVVLVRLPGRATASENLLEQFHVLDVVLHLYYIAERLVICHNLSQMRAFRSRGPEGLESHGSRTFHQLPKQPIQGVADL